MKKDDQLRGVLGLGHNSTHYYLQRIHQKYKTENCEFSTCPLIVYQVDFQEINPFLPNQFSILKPTLENYLNYVSQLGVSKLLIPNITLHETVDLMESPVKIIHAVDLTIQYLVQKNISSVVVFGTLYTMNSSYLRDKFSVQNIEVLVPSKEDQQIIDDFRIKVYQGIQADSEITDFQNLIRKYAEKSPVVIACTELSMFSVKDELFCIDMAELQIAEFLK